SAGAARRRVVVSVYKIVGASACEAAAARCAPTMALEPLRLVKAMNRSPLAPATTAGCAFCPALATVTGATSVPSCATQAPPTCRGCEPSDEHGASQATKNCCPLHAALGTQAVRAIVVAVVSACSAGVEPPSILGTKVAKI